MSTPVAQLARAESLRMVRNPALYLALIPVWFWVNDARAGDADQRLYLLTGFGLLLPGLVLTAITVMAVLRARYSNTEELLSATALGPDRRSFAHSISGLAGGAAMAAVIAVTLVALPQRFSDSLGTWSPFFDQDLVVPHPNVAQLLQGPLATVAVLSFVVALSRWIPSWLVLVPLVVLVLVQGLFLGMWHGTETRVDNWLFPLSTGVVNGNWAGCNPGDSICELPVSGFDTVTPWWHLGYLAALSVLFAAIAVLRHRRERGSWTWAGVSLAAVLAFAAVQALTFETYNPIPGS